jgi:hypothetical protein
VEDELVLVEVHLSEARLTNGLYKEGTVIHAGSRTICHAESNIILHDGMTVQNIHTKLDTCGSVSIAHSSYLTQVKGAREHGLPPIRLTGIGGRSGTLNMVDIVQLAAPDEKVKRILCYVYDSPLGPTEKILLLSLQSVIEASINIIHHMNMSIKGRCGPLTFWPDNKSLEQICRDITAIDLKPTAIDLKPTPPRLIYCWNRLMMGATPSSAVQQTAYLEALDEYIDYDEHGNLRACLLAPDGSRLLDADGNPKTLRHRFAVYYDDIATGANTLEELYDLFEALICCCAKAGIQIKAGKVKFGVRSIIFHNYITSEHGTEPKEANLCSIRNMNAPKDIHQIRAFLGCCQQLSHYIKDYGIIA